MPQQCSSCSHQSPDGAKFCLECGTPFPRACPACGHPVAGGKFCAECGTPLSAAVAPPPPPAAARPLGRRAGRPPEWLAERELTSFAVATVANAAWVQVQRGEVVDEPVHVERSEDPWERVVHLLWLSLHERSHGRAGDAVRQLPTAFHECFGDSGMYEDFEVLWAPSVELVLAAGDVDAAERLLGLAAPLDGPLGRPLTRGELPRLRALVALARGGDPEADLLAAIRQHDEYGAPYLAARSRLELGRWWHGQGRYAEAEPLLAAAHEVFTELRAAPSLAEVDALAVPVPA